MTSISSLAAIADVIGEPTRAAMLVALMDGRALTAGELAVAAGVSAPTASGHLGRMLEAGLIDVERQGRHRYFRLASATVATTIEGMMALSGELAAAAGRVRRISTGPRDQALRRARVCYDHLAGETAVAIADVMTRRGQLEWGEDGGVLTEAGAALLASIGVEIGRAPAVRARQAIFCRPCLDWSERRHHIGGQVGRALFAGLEQRDWLRRHRQGRGVTITGQGAYELERHFGVATGALGKAGQDCGEPHILAIVA